jgi:hypothetical protein
LPDRPAGRPVRLRLRSLLLVAAGLAMLAGLYGGLVRLGLPLPAGDGLVRLHGPIMVCGVFGTLIALERAVALGWRWPYLGPAASAAGTALLLGGAAVPIGAALYLLAALVLLAASLRIAVLQRELFTAVLAAGAGCWVAGSGLWCFGYEVPEIVGWWLGFLVLTIASERLELSRLLRPPGSARVTFLATVLLVAAGAALGIIGRPGAIVGGLGLLGAVAWLCCYDIAMRTIRGRGQTRFFAAAMLAGYAWLGVAGLLLLAAADPASQYDAVLHAVLIGFVVSMVFGHALIILPAVAGIVLRYHPALYLPLGLLQLSVALRVLGGVAGLESLRLASGPLTAAAILLFAVTLLLVRRRYRPG